MRNRSKLLVFAGFLLVFCSSAFAEISPTENPEEYERERLAGREEKRVPHWALGFSVQPNAFHSTDLRVPRPDPTSNAFKDASPPLLGLHVQGERFLFQKIGVVSVGAELGIYGWQHSPPFDGSILPVYFYSGEAFVHYQFLFLHNQWVVPSVRAGIEGLRYNYIYNLNRVNGLRAIYRYDLGLMIFLNVIEPKAAESAFSSFGIKRMYLTGYYTITDEETRVPIDLREHGFRVGLRFEL
ncbi:MAG: hypothetical protein AB7F43_03005 [Bacteriovoracia bacterium]